MVSTGSERRVAAQWILRDVQRRTALSEGVGILRVWQDCGARQARAALLAAHGQGAQNAEAARMIAVVDADAEGRADPDATWD